MKNLKVKNLKLTGWINTDALKDIIVCTEKPKRGKYIQVEIGFTPMLTKSKKVDKS